jgi:hypothetical protein
MTMFPTPGMVNKDKKNGRESGLYFVLDSGIVKRRRDAA